MGESNLFDNVKCIPGPSWFKSKVELKLADIYNQNWRAEVNDNSVCRNYKLIVDTDKKKLQYYFRLPKNTCMHWLNSDVQTVKYQP